MTCHYPSSPRGLLWRWIVLHIHPLKELFLYFNFPLANYPCYIYQSHLHPTSIRYMPTPFQDYDSISAKVWSDEHHPDEGWLQAVLSQGFSIMAIDGDRSNTHPDNLALIFERDSKKIEMALAGESSDPLSEWEETKVNKSQASYEMKLSGKRWGNISKLLNVSYSNAIGMARKYAGARKLKWPL